jgi:hypothetical protein
VRMAGTAFGVGGVLRSREGATGLHRLSTWVVVEEGTTLEHAAEHETKFRAVLYAKNARES